MTTVTQAADVPDTYKIAVYDALCRHFAATLDRYYTDDHPVDRRYDSGVVSPDDPPTHTVGIEVESDGSLFIVLNIKGWADLQGFSVELPTLTRDDCTDDGAALTLAGEGPFDEEDAREQENTSQVYRDAMGWAVDEE